MTQKLIPPSGFTRRGALKTLGLGAGALAATTAMPGFIQAQSSAPIRIGFQVHRTGIGASYGRWYDRTSQAAVKRINDAGGINGRMVELVPEDDGTDAKRGAEVIEKFATQSNCDVAFGTLFSHVVIGSAPRAGELKLPYFVVSEGHHVASGMLNRIVLIWNSESFTFTYERSRAISGQPGIWSNPPLSRTSAWPAVVLG